jgi:hypothetical protein
VAQQANGRCHVVFVTAFDDFAVKAVRAGAVDYVLKPLSVPRLASAVARLKERIGTAPPRLDGVIDRLAEPNEGRYLRWITASQGREVRLITVGEVCYFRSDNKYTVVVTSRGRGGDPGDVARADRPARPGRLLAGASKHGRQRQRDRRPRPRPATAAQRQAEAAQRDVAGERTHASRFRAM